MEFVNAFQQAQALGLTKEEFLDIWKTESDLKLAMHGRGQAAQQAVYEEEQQAHCSDAKDFIADLNVNQSTAEQRGQKEWEHELLQRFQSVCNQLIEKQEQQWQQMQHKSDLIIDELKSLKLHFVQKLELTKLYLEKVIKEQCVYNKSSPVQSQMLAQRVELASLQGTTIELEAPNCSYSNSIITNSINHNDQGKLQQQNDLFETSLERQTEGDKYTTVLEKEPEEDPIDKFLKEVIQDVKVKSLSNTVTGEVKDRADAGNEHKKFTDCPLDASRHGASSVESLNETDAEATGPFIKAIENQMKCTQSSHTSYVRPLHLSENGTTRSDDSNSLLITGEQLYTITISEGVNVFLSPFIYSSGKACKCRFRLNIETTGELSAHILVSKGVYDDDHMWPLLLSSTGFVLHRKQ